MQGNKFKAKIIGGKLVHVPDFDYMKEYDQNVVQSKNEGIKHFPQVYKGNRNTSKYSNKPRELDYDGNQSRQKGYVQEMNQGGQERGMVENPLFK